MLGSAKYRKLQAALDTIDIHTCILKIGKDKYQFIQNYEVKREYRQRRSCNLRLTKLYNTHKDRINGNN